MALDGLADSAVFGIELHGTDDASLLLRDTDHDHPLPIGARPVVDNLVALLAVSVHPASSANKIRGTHLQVGIAVEHFDGRCLGGVEDVPMVDGSVCDQAQCRLARPLPEGNILTHSGGL